MTIPDGHPIGPRWIPEAERTRILQDLMTGPRPRAIDPELKASLLAAISPDEAEMIGGILEIIEHGDTPIEDLLAELERMADDEGPPPPA